MMYLSRLRSSLFQHCKMPLSLVLAAGLISTPVIGGASEEPEVQPKPSIPTAQPAQNESEAGMRAFINPKTKKLRNPTAKELRRLQRQSKKKALSNNAATIQEAPVEKVLPSGAVALEVGERGMSYAVAKRNPDGSIATECDTESKSEQQALDKIKQSGMTLHQEINNDR